MTKWFGRIFDSYVFGFSMSLIFSLVELIVTASPTGWTNFWVYTIIVTVVSLLYSVVTKSPNK